MKVQTQMHGCLCIPCISCIYSIISNIWKTDPGRKDWLDMCVYFCECCISSDGFLWWYLFSFDNFLFFSRIKKKYEFLEDVLFLISLYKHCFKGGVAPDIIAFSVAARQVLLGLTYLTDPTDLFRTATFSPLGAISNLLLLFLEKIWMFDWTWICGTVFQNWVLPAAPHASKARSCEGGVGGYGRRRLEECLNSSAKEPLCHFHSIWNSAPWHLAEMSAGWWHCNLASIWTWLLS